VRAIRVALPVVAAMAMTCAAAAQSLQRVSVSAFTLGADQAALRAGRPFHLVVTLRLGERVSDVRNLQLPDLAGLDVLGDVRSVAASGRGTLYREAITVSAQHGGTIAIPPATFDAIDPHDGKAKEYSSNALVLHIGGTPHVWNVAIVLSRIAISLGVAMIVAGAILIFAIRRPRRAPPPEPPAPPPLPAPPQASVTEALALLVQDPNRAGALRAREVLWRMVGARDGETLADVMLRVRTTHPDLAAVMPAIERAAFTYDEDVDAAVAAALSALRSAAP
jgi:hypothetical protein